MHSRLLIREVCINMADRESKKQVPLRLSPQLYSSLAAWAESEFRSLNGQIEFLLTECVRQHAKNGASVPRNFSKTADPEEKDAEP